MKSSTKQLNLFGMRSVVKGLIKRGKSHCHKVCFFITGGPCNELVC